MGKAIKGVISFKRPRCTHMGCTLVWNEEERKYECTCHGSTFDLNGKPIDNPARSDLNRETN